MFQNSGLSLEQAPPISVVFRFFLAGSLFGIFGGVWLMMNGGSALDSSDSAGVVMTHILTLGVMLPFMFGALEQMLPVLGGVVIREPVKTAIRTQYPMLVGTIVLLCALRTSSPEAYLVAAILLSLAIVPISLKILSSLLAVKSHSSSSRGMGLALFNLLLLLFIALRLLAARNGLGGGEYYPELKSAHIAFGLYGWIALLIVSVSFQVIEMFYVAKAYPPALSHYLPPSLVILAVANLIGALHYPPLMPWLEGAMQLALLIYAIYTLERLYRRKRRAPDTTVRFWMLSMLSLSLSMLISIASKIFTPAPELEILNYILYFSFASGVLFAMTYKIVPFLTWFHLSSEGYLDAPMMHEVISPAYGKYHLWIELATILLAILSIFVPALWTLTGASMALSFIWLTIAVGGAWRKYLYTHRHSKRFDMGSFRL